MSVCCTDFRPAVLRCSYKFPLEWGGGSRPHGGAALPSSTIITLQGATQYLLTGQQARQSCYRKRSQIPGSQRSSLLLTNGAVRDVNTRVQQGVLCLRNSTRFYETSISVYLLNARHPDVLLMTIKTYKRDKTQKIYYNLLLQGYMFRLLRVIISATGSQSALGIR